jgi:hypothetical protein
MDLEESEARYNYAGEGQQQFDRPTESLIRPCVGGFGNFHCSPASRRRRRNRNPVLGGISVTEECKYGNLALQVGGVSNLRVKYGHKSCRTRSRE